MKEVFIIKYGELWLKSEFVRNRFARKLAENIRRMLKREKIAFTLARHRDMIVLDTGSKKAEEVLKRAFGVSWFARAKETGTAMREMEGAVIQTGKGIKKDETFAVRASRSDKSFRLSSMNVENRMGSLIDRKVNLSGPDVTIFVEIKKEKAYVYSEKIKGPGGLPYGVSGRVVSMLSGGIDSPVSSWLMMKRGCSVDFINFYTDEKGRKNAKELVSSLSRYSPEKMNLHSVPYGEILGGIAKHADRKFTCVLCKRLMYRISESFAERVKAKAIVTGENLGQVASQTLDNLSTNSGAVGITILRPLIGMDKEETISLAKAIGTFGISVKDSDPCAFVPKAPSTSAKPGRTALEEGKIRGIDGMIQRAVVGSGREAL